MKFTTQKNWSQNSFFDGARTFITCNGEVSGTTLP